MSTSENSCISWIQWFCSQRGHEFFCEVDDAYLSDNFNLTGIEEFVPRMGFYMKQILDYDSAEDDRTMDEDNTVASLLYGLVHARYILSNRGLADMADKFERGEFGTCPRVFCNGSYMLPIGLNDVPNQDTVKMFCPCCEEIYNPKFARHKSIDGAFFGTTFPQMLLMQYENLRPKTTRKVFTPRLYGFKVHKNSYGPPQNS